MHVQSCRPNSVDVQSTTLIFIILVQFRSLVLTHHTQLREAIEADDGGEKSIVWSADGKSFIITSPRVFVDTVLPKYFKQTKFASFTRKLNRWGFKRITKGPNAGAYFHRLFQKDKPKLCLKMVCQKVCEIIYSPACIELLELAIVHTSSSRY